MIEIFIWLLIIVLVVFAGFFAGSETVLVYTDKHMFQEKAKKGNIKAKTILSLLDKPDRFLATTLVGTNISVVSVGILFKYRLEALLPYLNDIQSSLYTTLIVTLFMLIFSEIVPKTLGLLKSNTLAYLSTSFLNIVYYIFFPIILIVRGISKSIEKILQFDKEKKSISAFSHKGELKSFVNKTSLIEDIESLYITNIMNYSKTISREIMTPLVDVYSIEVNSSVEELIGVMLESSFSRIPVYQRRVDNIVGYINTMDMIYDTDEKYIKSFIKEPFFIPETKKIGALLMDMQRRKIPMVFVVDEYGGASGLITAEDIAEEIVGDILMEKEEESVIIIKEGEQMEINAQADVDDLNEEYNLNIKKDGFETLGGFIMYVLGHIPKKGEHFNYNGYTYTVYDSNLRSVNKIIVSKVKKKNNYKRGI
jgi:CBS domain containing-hemolysin-like protein